MLTALSTVTARELLLAAYVILSAASFVMYGVDKAAAVHGGRRIPESSMHLVSLAGGWPGAWVGQRVFRHKTSKQPFQILFWCTVVVNSAAGVWTALTFPG